MKVFIDEYVDSEDEVKMIDFSVYVDNERVMLGTNLNLDGDEYWIEV